MGPLDLTFGVELEFICVHPVRTFTDRYPDLLVDPDEEVVRAESAVQWALTRHGVPATGCEEPGAVVAEVPYSRWRVDVDSCRLSLYENPVVPADHVASAVELASRVYRVGEPDFIHDLIRVLAALRAMEDDFACLFLTNHTTGFHVHVGNGARPFPLATAKRVLQLMTAHERSFDLLHPAHRVLAPLHSSVDPENLHAPPHFAPLSFFHHLAHPLAERPDAFAWLLWIEESVDFASLGTLCAVPWDNGMLCGHNAAVNCDNTFADPERRRSAADLTHTLEFRQHAGTRDLHAIRDHVIVLTTLVLRCHGASEASFLHLLAAGADLSFGPARLLHALGVPRHVAARQMGPATPPTPSPAPGPLLALSLRNAAEQASALLPHRATRVVARKWRSLYYGFDPRRPPPPLSRERVLAMMRNARTRTVRRSDAVADVFSQLARFMADDGSPSTSGGEGTPAGRPLRE